MSSPAVSRKRKADALEADGEETSDLPDGTGKRKSAPDDDSSALLPAPCLAAVLNFMRYADVRQCMLAGKMMAVEAAGHVETLNITKASELDAPSARRFRNASEVNVLCLISEVDEEDENNHEDQISMEAVTRVVPFLSSIPSLERVYVGGVYLDGSVVGTEVWERYLYSNDECDAPREHQTIFNALVQNIIGGFQSRTLTQNLELDGILKYRQFECAGNLGEDPDNPCRFCRHILSSFPLHLLLRPISNDEVFCVSRADCIRAILHRDGAEALLRSDDGTKMLLRSLIDEIPQVVWRSSKSEVEEAFVEKMCDQGAKYSYVQPGTVVIKWQGKVAISKSFTDFLDLVKSSSLLKDAIKGIPRSSLVEPRSFERGGGGGYQEGGQKTVFARQIFENLLEAGLQLDASDFIILDPEKELALSVPDADIYSSSAGRWVNSRI